MLNDKGHRPNWCIHYRSPLSVVIEDDPSQPEACGAGVLFSKWSGVEIYKRPCHLTDLGESLPGALPCEHLRRPTPEEIAAAQEWSIKRTADLFAGLMAVYDWRRAQTRLPVRATLVCPVCKTGTLHVYMAANRHVQAKCTTADCLAWIE